MQSYAKLRGLKRIYIPIPCLRPYWSSLIISLITPIQKDICNRLIQSVGSPSICSNSKAINAFKIPLLHYEEALELAIKKEKEYQVDIHWSNTLALKKKTHYIEKTINNQIIDGYSIYCESSPRSSFKIIQRIGGHTGWYYWNTLWKIRGFIDDILGGPGLNRGRNHPIEIRIGDCIDWWRVVAFEPNRFLKLEAEMKIPGDAWLEFEVQSHANGSMIYQTVIYAPKGLWGIIYWKLLYPIHKLMFKGMLKKIKSLSECSSH